MSGNYVDSRDKLELKNLKSRIGKTEISGWASMARTGTKHIEADLASPRLDLTPLSKKEADSKANDEIGRWASASPADAKQPAKEPKGKYVFSEEPIKLDGLKRADAKLHFVAKEVKLAAGVLKDVDGTLVVDAGQLAFEGRAKGGIEGTLNSARQTEIDERRRRRRRAQSGRQEHARRSCGRRRDRSAPRTTDEHRGEPPGERGLGTQAGVECQRAGSADAGTRQDQERFSRHVRRRHPRPAREQAESVLGAGPVHPAGLHRGARRHRGRPGDGRARAHAVEESHRHRKRQGGSSHRRAHSRLQHPSARGHRCQPGNVHESLHQARRDTREPKDCELAPRARHPAPSPQQPPAYRWSRKESWTAPAERRTLCKKTLEEATHPAAPAEAARDRSRSGVGSSEAAAGARASAARAFHRAAPPAMGWRHKRFARAKQNAE